MKLSEEKKTEIMKFIEDYERVLFVELMRHFPEVFGGDSVLGVTERNIVFWGGLNEELSELIMVLDITIPFVQRM